MRAVPHVSRRHLLGANLQALLRELHRRCGAIGFDDREIYHQIVLDDAQRDIPMERILASEAIEVFREWEAKPDKVPY